VPFGVPPIRQSGRVVNAGLVIVLMGIASVIRVETFEGFRHLLDLDWVLNDDVKWPIVTGRTATVCKLISRVMLAVGGVLVLLGVLLGV